MRRHLKKLYWVLLVPAISFAANPGVVFPTNPGDILPGKGSSDTFEGTVLGIIRLFLQVVGLIAVAYVIYGGFRYVTAGGNDEVTKSAKKTITNSLIGLVVVILSYVLVNIVINAAFNRVR